MAPRHWVALTSAACQWSKTARVTLPCKSIAAAILIVSFLITLSGCDDGSTSSRRGGGGGRAAPTNQQRAEILVGTMATLFSLEEYELGQAQQLVMTRINQWMRGQEPKSPWQREPRLGTLPANLRDLRAIDALGENDFLYDDDFAMLREAVWMDRISSHLRSAMDREATKPDQGRASMTVRYVSPDDPEQLRLAMQLFDWTVKNVQLEVDEWPDEKTGYTYKLREHCNTP